jgi:IS30 family transposase
MVKKLNKEERIEIYSLLQAGCKNYEIAVRLGRSESTISREISRNKDSTGRYHYSLAHNKTKERRRDANRLRIKIILNGEVENHLEIKLKTGWSPQQIAGRLKVNNPFEVNLSHQTIYQHIYLFRPEWKKYLRVIGIKGKYRRKYGTRIREKMREEMKRKRIDTRPQIIEDRQRLGDWEGDTIVGKEKSVHILTHVDRKSGFLIADKVEDITKEGIQKLTLNSFQKLPKTKIKSITYDNGVQFNKFEDTEQKLKKQTKNDYFNIYFAYPYHSWERGTNENTNGLLRQYFPKKTEFKKITQKELDEKVKLINNRPRKRLGYLTPNEVFKERKLIAIRI